MSVKLQAFIGMILLLVLCTTSPVIADSSPPMPPFAIFGSVTIEGEPIEAEFGKYRVIVTRPDMTAFDPPAQDVDGLDPDLQNYLVKIPVYDENSHPDAPRTGDELVIRVYFGKTELPVTAPEGGVIFMRGAGASERIDLDLRMPVGPGDVNNDGRIGLAEVIFILRDLAGVEQ